MANNLEQQGGTWHVRMAIPADVRKAFGGRKVLSKSLETGLRSEAMDRRLPYLVQWKAEIAAARAQAQALKENWRPELATWGHDFDKDVSARFLAASKRIPEVREHTPEELEATKQKLFDAAYTLYMNAQKLEDLGTSGVVDLVKKYGAQKTISDMDVVQQSAGYHRELTALITTAQYGLTPVEAAEAKAIALDPTVYKPKSPITKARLEAFRAYRKARDISAKNIDAQESKLEKLSAFFATTGKPLDFDCVSAWLDSIDAASKTKQQYLNAGNTFWKWAMKHDARWREDFKGAVTPFENHDLPQLRGKGKVDAQRLAFELSDLSTLHAAAHEKKLNTLADLILLGTYSGARIEELCQLRTEHVISPDGVQSFNIVDSKTAAGIRVVPVHPALKPLMQRLINDSKDGFLVTSDSKNKYGNRSDLLSKAFGRLKKSLGFGPLHVFHSIRKSAITQLVRADVTGTLIAELVGHETGTVTYDVYNQGASAAQKLAAISKLPTLTAE
jgi:integrase